MKKPGFKSLLLCILFIGSLAPAVTPSNSTDMDLAKDTIVPDKEIEIPHPLSVVKNLPEDLLIWGNELVNPDNLPTVLGLVGFTSVLVMGDHETWRTVRNGYRSSGAFKSFCDYGELLSNGTTEIGFSAGLLIYGSITSNHRALRTVAQVIESYLASGIITQIMKASTGRESPGSSTTRTGNWTLFDSYAHYKSDTQAHDAMPSGHFTSLVSTMRVIEENYPEYPWIQFASYPLYAWAAVGLVGQSVHWWSDFPIAGALGYEFAKIVTRKNHTIVRGPAQPAQKPTPLWKPEFIAMNSIADEPIAGFRWKF